MNHCSDREIYLDREFEGDKRARFEEHLRRCAACRSEVGLWQDIESEVRGITASGIALLVGGGAPGEAAGAREDGDPRRFDPRRFDPGLVVRVGGAVAAAAVVVALAAALLWPAGPGEEHPKAAPASRAILLKDRTGTVEREVSVGEVIEIPAGREAVVEIGGDRLELKPDTRLVMAEANAKSTRIGLEMGTVICEVSPRRDGSFIVEAGAYEVRVVGTRFAVTRSGEGDLRVKVDSGTVEVAGGRARRWILGRGEHLDLSSAGRATGDDPADPGAAEPQDAPPVDEPEPWRPRIAVRGAGRSPQADETLDSASSPSRAVGPDRGKQLETWRKWIVEDRLPEASAALEVHLHRHTDDAEAWWLLAGCRRKARSWTGTVAALERVVAVAGPILANQARYRAGVVYQEELGNQGRAAALYREYLESAGRGKALEAEAMKRLARALIALGRRDDAADVLENMARRFEGTPLAVEARETLEELRGFDKK